MKCCWDRLTAAFNMVEGVPLKSWKMREWGVKFEVNPGYSDHLRVVAKFIKEELTISASIFLSNSLCLHTIHLTGRCQKMVIFAVFSVIDMWYLTSAIMFFSSFSMITSVQVCIYSKLMFFLDFFFFQRYVTSPPFQHFYTSLVNLQWVEYVVRLWRLVVFQWLECHYYYYIIVVT